MQVNVTKTLGIPLWPAVGEEASEMVGRVVPKWRQFPISTSATYLGCCIGPGKIGQEWQRAAPNYWKRIAAWPWATLGLHFASVVYSTYAASTLAFAGQFAIPDHDLLKLEAAGLRKAAPGPGAWVTPADLWHLREHYGLAQNFSSIAEAAQASKLRITFCDNAKEGGLRVKEWHNRLEECARCLRFPSRQLWWQNWRGIAVPEILWQNWQSLESQGISGSKILAELVQKSAKTHSLEEAQEKARCEFQKTVRMQIRAKDRYSAHYRIRTNLERWRLAGLPRVVADRFAERISCLNRLAPPRVAAAVFSTGWNRWCTFRRFQQRSNPLNTCKIGCGGEAEDSIEHYCRCRIMRRFHREELGLDSDWLLPHWLGVQGPPVSVEQHFQGALGAYAAYRITNMARHCQGCSEETARRAFQQALVEGTIGHPRAASLLRSLRMSRQQAYTADRCTPPPSTRRRLITQESHDLDTVRR